MLDKPTVHTVPTTFINMNSKFHDFELLRNPEYLMPLTSMSLLAALFSLGGCIHFPIPVAWLLYHFSGLAFSLMRISRSSALFVAKISWSQQEFLIPCLPILFLQKHYAGLQSVYDDSFFFPYKLGICVFPNNYNVTISTI